jgi:hypothetical protein
MPVSAEGMLQEKFLYLVMMRLDESVSQSGVEM